MKNIAVIGDNKKPKFFESVFKQESIEYDKFNVKDILDNIQKLEGFDVVFLNLEHNIKDITNIIKNIKNLDKNIIIVVTSPNFTGNHINKAISSGADDFLKQPINKSMILKKVSNYKTLLDFRKNRIHENESFYNLFTDKIFSRNTRFNINKEDDLSEFWEYFILNASSEDSLCKLNFIFSIGEWLIRNNNKFFIVSEEDREYYYLTFKYTPIPQTVIHNLIIKSCVKESAKMDDFRLSIKFNKTTQQETQLPQDIKEEKTTTISAKEFVDSTPLEITTKMDALEDIEEALTVKINQFSSNKDRETLKAIGELFKEYASTVFLMNEFDKLSEAIDKIAEYIENADEETIDENADLIVSVFYSLVDDLIKWRTGIFVNQETSDIHYLDNSMIASCLQIEHLLNKNSSNQDNDYGDVEFF